MGMDFGDDDDLARDACAASPVVAAPQPIETPEAASGAVEAWVGCGDAHVWSARDVSRDATHDALTGGARRDVPCGARRTRSTASAAVHRVAAVVHPARAVAALLRAARRGRIGNALCAPV